LVYRSLSDKGLEELGKLGIVLFTSKKVGEFLTVHGYHAGGPVTLSPLVSINRIGVML
jgi:hypothetical protein